MPDKSRFVPSIPETLPADPGDSLRPPPGTETTASEEELLLSHTQNLREIDVEVQDTAQTEPAPGGHVAMRVGRCVRDSGALRG